MTRALVTFAASSLLLAPAIGQSSGQASDYELTAGGWVFMIASVAFVWVLTFWCFKRVLTAPRDEPNLPAGLGP